MPEDKPARNMPRHWMKFTEDAKLDEAQIDQFADFIARVKGCTEKDARRTFSYEYLEYLFDNFQQQTQG